MNKNIHELPKQMMNLDFIISLDIVQVTQQAFGVSISLVHENPQICQIYNTSNKLTFYLPTTFYTI